VPESAPSGPSGQSAEISAAAGALKNPYLFESSHLNMQGLRCRDRLSGAVGRRPIMFCSG
jgi:hypothetical protein